MNKILDREQRKFDDTMDVLVFLIGVLFISIGVSFSPLPFYLKFIIFGGALIWFVTPKRGGEK